FFRVDRQSFNARIEGLFILVQFFVKIALGKPDGHIMRTHSQSTSIGLQSLFITSESSECLRPPSPGAYSYLSTAPHGEKSQCPVVGDQCILIVLSQFQPRISLLDIAESIFLIILTGS